MKYIIATSFILFDFISGIIKALKNHEFSSCGMREGLYHKVGSLLTISFGALADYGQRFVDMNLDIPISSAICSYITIMEISSIIENLGQINPNILPDKIKKFFKKLDRAEDLHNEI